MNILRNAIKSRVSVLTVKPTHALPSFLRESPRRFSTESNQRQPPSPEASVDAFIDSASKGFVYGKLFGATKYTMKSDIISLLEGCNLTPDDIKVSYNRNFFPVAMMLRFPSPSAFSNATRTIRKFDRLYRLDRANAGDWDIVTPYNGKTVVLQGLPRSVGFEDIERFLSGCDYDSSSVQSFTLTRPGSTNVFRLTTVQFPSHIQAMSACISKNRKVCLNNQVSVRVLY
ncbi:putative Tetratricopeptide repeat-like superfamily protein [Hibiscus syriacus]|uniref:Tetratricopeptide repeat-like superfamily protein n=1 Tax=Hibiscus syriacus TaxID=106335 RepID=A0A6A3AD77_HIBSY|nr:uncharacterized protein LOC120128703 [Hibiscus syriacus]KAE8702494.1 putative Tetratricopeptide repeat-like superfamily protein [Hibiscus syriacus]